MATGWGNVLTKAAAGAAVIQFRDGKSPRMTRMGTDQGGTSVSIRAVRGFLSFAI